MSTDIISTVDFYDPDNLIPYAELDEAIVRPLTLGLLDFSNPSCHDGSGDLLAGEAVTSLTADRSGGVVSVDMGAITAGMLEIPSDVTGPKLALPNTFILPSDCTKFLAIIWTKAPETGWVGAGSSVSLIGALNNVTNLAQWGIAPQVNGGVVNNFRVFVPISDASAGIITLPTGVRDAVFNGVLHQLGLEWSVDLVGNLSTLKFYVDRALVHTATAVFTASSIIVPAITPSIGRPSGSFAGDYPPNLWVGRPSLWNLTGSTKPVADILALDADAADGILA